MGVSQRHCTTYHLVNKLPISKRNTMLNIFIFCKHKHEAKDDDAVWPSPDERAPAIPDTRRSGRRAAGSNDCAAKIG